MKLIVGLGNPERKHADTRHNVGFRVCDALAAAMSTPLDRQKFQARAAEVATPRGTLMILEPQTYMNLSGRSVAAAVRFYQLDLDDVLVVCDDFNLPCGQLRLRRGGSHGGHNGLRDIIERLATDGFPRLRLGTGPLVGRDPVAFCLTRFEPDEAPTVQDMIAAGAEAARTWLDGGIDEAMNRYNAKGSPLPDPTPGGPSTEEDSM